MQPSPIGPSVKGPIWRFASMPRLCRARERLETENPIRSPGETDAEPPRFPRPAVPYSPGEDRSMGEYAFGGPRGGIIQTAFVVKDIRESIASWIADCRVGPWFLLDHFSGDHPVYRGRPSTADVAIAMAFAGHMQIELIQPNDANPSVYK